MKFDVIVADCPWPFQDTLQMSSVKRGAQANYSLLDLPAIQNLKVPEVVADDAVLALWVPSSLLQEGLDTMKAWGFLPKQTWIWIKVKKDPLSSLRKYLKKNIKTHSIDKIFEDFTSSYWFDDLLSFGMGRIARNVHEVALIGTKGKFLHRVQNKSQRTVFFDVNYKHSQKTEILQNRLDKIFPDQSLARLELFGRRERANWTVVGNQSPSSLNEDVRDSINRLKSAT